jgi:predicted membrane channel-forming protein YqfA (hemolysin III family)
LIKTGYRVGYHGFMPIFKTLFKWHNETVNIWSHFLGQLLFIGILIATLRNYPLMHKIGELGLTEF